MTCMGSHWCAAHGVETEDDPSASVARRLRSLPLAVHKNVKGGESLVRFLTPLDGILVTMTAGSLLRRGASAAICVANSQKPNLDWIGVGFGGF
jgi:hypothetical protein